MNTPSTEKPTSPQTCACGGGSGRRGFLGQALAMFAAALAYATPVAAAAVALLNPLRQKGSGGAFLRLASLDTLPDDGTPHKFPVIAERVDAWTRSVGPVGAVYLRRTGPDQVEAIHVVCPHAGCTVEYKEVTAGDKAVAGFICPCHKAIFDATGKRLEEKSQSPRDLDTLDVEIRNGSEVWVQFQNFKLGTPDKVPLT